ncbi:alpha/beta hydrolase [Streptomyces sp. TLI_171]|uniref:alpha/beta hydrolase n=1 Tax=Streptomyces sp. TLI_171 TaxID=1938859 RepID=UPI000C1A830E|nr:alpha/beta hydrolase [Streptomyces sp. TLI_171]RKE18951.1 alpha/beta hydrolase family protein [Streptomyces sp. TLI_171]
MLSRLRRGTAVAGLVLVAVLGVGSWASAEGPTPLTGPPGVAAWDADTTLGVRLPEPATSSPAEVAAFFDTLPLAQRDALAVRHPQVVGNLDGAPVALRLRANALAVEEERAKEQSRAEDPSRSEGERAAAAAKASRYAGLSGRQLLAFDPRGRGQVAEVFGDLAHDGRTAVLVPGADVDLTTYDRGSADGYDTLAGMARSLRAASGDRVAVVAWAGYPTPRGFGVDVAREELADAGAERLDRLVAGLAPVTGPVALFCHSYGSVVCGRSEPDPRLVSQLVVLASPGMGLERAEQVAVPVWAVRRNAEDWISEVPNVSLFGFGHGADPTAAEFHARLLPSAGSHGHSGYFAPGSASLAAFAALALTGSPSAS